MTAKVFFTETGCYHEVRLLNPEIAIVGAYIQPNSVTAKVEVYADKSAAYAAACDIWLQSGYDEEARQREVDEWMADLEQIARVDDETALQAPLLELLEPIAARHNIEAIVIFGPCIKALFAGERPKEDLLYADKRCRAQWAHEVKAILQAIADARGTTLAKWLTGRFDRLVWPQGDAPARLITYGIIRGWRINGTPLEVLP